MSDTGKINDFIRCKNCVYYEKKDEREGYCKKKAPHRGKLEYATWILIGDPDGLWCGEWEYDGS